MKKKLCFNDIKKTFKEKLKDRYRGRGLSFSYNKDNKKVLRKVDTIAEIISEKEFSKLMNNYDLLKKQIYLKELHDKQIEKEHLKIENVRKVEVNFTNIQKMFSERGIDADNSYDEKVRMKKKEIDKARRNMKSHRIGHSNGKIGKNYKIIRAKIDYGQKKYLEKEEDEKSKDINKMQSLIDCQKKKMRRNIGNSVFITNKFLLNNKYKENESKYSYLSGNNLKVYRSISAIHRPSNKPNLFNSYKRMAKNNSSNSINYYFNNISNGGGDNNIFTTNYFNENINSNNNNVYFLNYSNNNINSNNKYPLIKKEENSYSQNSQKNFELFSDLNNSSKELKIIQKPSQKDNEKKNINRPCRCRCKSAIGTKSNKGIFNIFNQKKNINIRRRYIDNKVKNFPMYVLKVEDLFNRYNKIKAQSKKMSIDYKEKHFATYKEIENLVKVKEDMQMFSVKRTFLENKFRGPKYKKIDKKARFVQKMKEGIEIIENL